MKLFGAVACVFLLAGLHSATPVSLNAGEEYTFTVAAIPFEVASCHLKTPEGIRLDFFHGVTEVVEGRYVLQPTSSQFCSVTVNHLQENDSGEWVLSYISTIGTGNIQSFQITVEGTENQEVTTPEEDEHIEWLDLIEHPTRSGVIIDISLPKITEEEKCTIRVPDRSSHTASELHFEGIIGHESSSFVSCRFTIGPMAEDLIGDWAVCGEHTENGEERKRCQPVKIFWNNANRPDTVWGTQIQAPQEHPVNYGKVLAPTVIGNGEVVTCHIVTPNGEDLVITHGSLYPHIEAHTISHSICTIAIGPIDKDFLGDWILYGIFRNSVTGLNEVRLPFHMFLYDEENPYEQAYYVTDLGTVNRVVNLGNTLYTEVSVLAGHIDNCIFETPSGEIYDLNTEYHFTGASFVGGDPTDLATVFCRLAIGPITKEMLGYWKLIGKFRNNDLFTEIHQTFHVIEEDPENPVEEDREIHYLDPQVINTGIGGEHSIVIHSDTFIHGESCHIRTPDGLQYKIMEGFSLEGVTIIEESGVECGVDINVVSENEVGEWTLIARSTRYSEAYERRLPFTIYVEAFVAASANEIILSEGDDLYVQLRYPTDLHETCKLIGPYGFECPSAERDPAHVETCGFFRKNMQSFNAGTWTIQYGNRIIYKAETVVTVNPSDSDSGSFMTTLDLIRDRSVEKLVGPENAIYCRLVDPQGFAVFDGFGRCNLSLDKVLLEHNGIWNMHVGTTGKVLTDDYQLFVTVRESEGKAVVTTHVEKQQPIVIVSCAVETAAVVQACKFRDPQGRILLAANGVSEDRYEYHGSQVSYETEVKTHECGLRITDPATSDLGMWRCSIETTEDTYYGHMAVLCPWSLSNPDIAAVVQQVPILKADRTLVSVVEENPGVVSCSVEAPIRYCYFRTANGTTFTVTPGLNTPSMQYVGAGFDAGECGIRFTNMFPSDSGRWSCNVGLVGEHEEHTDQFQTTVHERMRVDHYMGHGNVMYVEGIVYEGRALEYCRFVRMDGFGFTSENVPAEYTLTGLLANGECQFTSRAATIIDRHPWTVVAKIRGQDEEIARYTRIFLSTPTPETTPEPQPEQEQPAPDHGHGVNNNNRGLQIFFYTFMSVLLLAVLMGIWLGPKRHRDWTYRRASELRSSFNRGFKKEPIQPHSNA